jgi:hypothetical protein
MSVHRLGVYILTIKMLSWDLFYRACDWLGVWLPPACVKLREDCPSEVSQRPDNQNELRVFFLSYNVRRRPLCRLHKLYDIQHDLSRSDWRLLAMLFRMQRVRAVYSGFSYDGRPCVGRRGYCVGAVAGLPLKILKTRDAVSLFPYTYGKIVRC